jgi:WD40 repeat protein
MDATLAQWDISTSEKIFSAKGGHDAAVTCIYADDSKVISGSADKSIIVWSIEGMMIRRVRGHDRGVHCVQCGAGWCISASYGTVFVWDILTKETNKISGVSDTSCMFLSLSLLAS